MKNTETSQEAQVKFNHIERVLGRIIKSSTDQDIESHGAKEKVETARHLVKAATHLADSVWVSKVARLYESYLEMKKGFRDFKTRL